MTAAHSKRIFGLDIVRAAAILMVLGSHTLSLFDSPDFRGIELLHFFGYFGVEVFFVLSGFLIGNILLKMYVRPDFSFAHLKVFWIRRWLRTLPNYFLALAINLLLAFFVWEDIPERIWSYVVFLQNVTVQPLFFNESWSLSIEEYTYLLFPLLLFGCYRLLKKRAFIVTIMLFLVAFLAAKIIYHFTIAIPDLNYWGLHMKSVLIYRIDAIVYGVLAAWAVYYFPGFILQNKNLLLVAGVLIVAFLLVGIGRLPLTIKQAPFFWNVIYLPLTSISVMLVMPFFNSFDRSASWATRIITLISKISYSVYLFHYFIILYLFTEFVKPFAITALQKGLYAAAYLLVTFGVACIVYCFFEKPILNWRDRNYRS